MDKWSQYLKSERLRRGLSLHEVALKAEVSISLLKALEQGRLPDIGSAALVRSHLLAYSRALGVSPLPPTHRPAPHTAPTSPTPPDLPQPQDPRLAAKKTGILRLAAFGIIGFLAVVVYNQIDGISQPDRQHPISQPSDTGASPESPAISETPTSASAASEPEGSNENPSNPAEKRAPPAIQGAGLTAQQEGEQEPPLAAVPTALEDAEESASGQPPVSLHHRFQIEAFQASWVEVKHDGGKTDGFLLRPGEKREWQAVQELQILVGNAGGVQMKWDGAPVNLGGRPGQVLRMRLPHPDFTGKPP